MTKTEFINRLTTILDEDGINYDRRWLKQVITVDNSELTGATIGLCLVSWLIKIAPSFYDPNGHMKSTLERCFGVSMSSVIGIMGQPKLVPESRYFFCEDGQRLAAYIPEGCKGTIFDFSDSEQEVRFALDLNQPAYILVSESWLLKKGCPAGYKKHRSSCLSGLMICRRVYGS